MASPGAPRAAVGDGECVLVESGSAADAPALYGDGNVTTGLCRRWCRRGPCGCRRMRAVVEPAEDDGGSVSGWAAGAPRNLDRVSRCAVSAAVNGRLDQLSRSWAGRAGRP